MRTTVTALVLLLASVAVAADPEIPADKRKAIIEAVIAKKPKSQEELAARLKALAKAKIDPKTKADIYPEDPTEPPTFRSKQAKDEYAKRIAKELTTVDADAKRFADNPLSFAPGLNAIDKGEFGTITNPLLKVTEVVDKRQVLLTLTQIDPTGKPPARITFLLTGEDTSGLSEGKAHRLSGAYYVVGIANVSGQRVMQLVPLVLTSEERAKLGIKEPPPPEKK